jgi:leucyl aminopeptidase
LVAELAVRQAAYMPLQQVEANPSKKRKLAQLALKDVDGRCSERAFAIEAGRNLARDIGSADPERMAPLKVAEIVRTACEPAGVTVDVIDDAERLQAEYPLLNAVARASLHVPRHRPCVVRLSWCGKGDKERTVLLAGKGVTYDTGGADVKVGGGMAGMRQDKCGVAAAVGFVLACAVAPEEQTRGLCVIVEIGCVRNSTGSDAYVADEIVVSHAGKRVLVGNTDMEGRMVLADCLSHLRRRAIVEGYPSPCILSLATLTGHATRSHGP